MSEPIDQKDFGYGYKGVLSPQQHMSLKVEGGMLAVTLALLALGGVLVAAILVPEIIEARAHEAAAAAYATAAYAERDSRVALDKIGYIQSALDRNGIRVEQEH